MKQSATNRLRELAKTREAQTLREAPRCPVCDKPMPKYRHFTCSTECSLDIKSVGA